MGGDSLKMGSHGVSTATISIDIGVDVYERSCKQAKRYKLSLADYLREMDEIRDDEATARSALQAKAEMKGQRWVSLDEVAAKYGL